MAVVSKCKSFGTGPFSSYILKWYETIHNTDESIQKVYSIEKSLQGIRLTNNCHNILIHNDTSHT